MENLKKSFLVRGNNIVGFSDKKNFSTAPLGTVLSFAGQARPNGYLLCDGASYKVTDYPDLYAVIGNTYGGDSTNFNVPNLVDASQSPAPTMIYIIKAFHTNEGVDSDAGSGEENKIDSISVNGSPVSIDENKNVDITVPDAYDDTALVKRVSDIESDYAKTTEIPLKVSQLENDSNYLSSIPEEYVTETELEAKGYLTEHQDLSDYATKDEIPTVPSKVSELTNDSNYQTAEQVNSTVTTEIAKVVANAPEDFDTLKEMSDWIAGHENDVSAMNSAISDNKTNIETLQTDVANINTSLGGKLDKTFTGTDVANKILSTDGDGNVVLKDGNEDDTMLKSVYDTDDDGIVDKADSANIATNATDATNAENLKLSDGTIVDADTINTKLSKVDNKIDKPASATNGQVLTYNGTSNEWEAQDSKGGTIIRTSRTRRDITSDLANLPTAIAEQDLAKYGYAIGDYFVGASGYYYYLADMDTNYGGYNNYAIVNTHHCGIVVDTKSTCQWLASGSVTNYSSSTLHLFLTNTALPKIKSDIATLFGDWASHLLTRTERDNAIGGWGTIEDCLICAMTEVQMHGSRVFGADGHQTGTGSKALELFRKYRFNEIYGSINVWLKSLFSESIACLASSEGVAGNGFVSTAYRASGLILFH